MLPASDCRTPASTGPGVVLTHSSAARDNRRRRRTQLLGDGLTGAAEFGGEVLQFGQAVKTPRGMAAGAKSSQAQSVGPCRDRLDA